MPSNNDFLDIGIDYLNTHSEPLERPLSPEDKPKLSEKDRQKQKEERDFERLKEFNTKLEAMLDVKYDLNQPNYENNCQAILKDEGNFALSTLNYQIHKVYVRMINNDDITKEIKDKKFQNYLSIRKNLEKLLAKIDASKNPRLNYIRPNLNVYMKELDKYLLAYLVDLNFKSSKENIITFIKRKLRSKKK